MTLMRALSGAKDRKGGGESALFVFFGATVGETLAGFGETAPLAVGGGEIGLEAEELFGRIGPGDIARGAALVLVDSGTDLELVSFVGGPVDDGALGNGLGEDVEDALGNPLNWSSDALFWNSSDPCPSSYSSSRDPGPMADCGLFPIVVKLRVPLLGTLASLVSGTP